MASLLHRSGHLQGMSSDAIFDPGLRYRYALTRAWDEALPRLLVCMLNPSTADAERDDPTVRRCIHLSRAWRYGAMSIVNLFALRSTDPCSLASAPDPVGPDNDRIIDRVVKGADAALLAWGDSIRHASPRHNSRAALVTERLMRLAHLFTLGRTTKGNPRHPLFVPRTAQLIPIDEPEKWCEAAGEIGAFIP